MKARILAEADESGRKRPTGLQLLNLPASGKQNIHQQTLAEWRDYVTVTPAAIIVHTVDGDVQFDIDQPPGRYCLTCGERLPDMGSSTNEESLNAQKCLAHVAEHKKAATSDRWPHGYSHRPKSYTCTIRPTKLTEALQNG
jgi:hypothetical protein